MGCLGVGLGRGGSVWPGGVARRGVIGGWPFPGWVRVSQDRGLNRGPGRCRGGSEVAAIETGMGQGVNPRIARTTRSGKGVGVLGQNSKKTKMGVVWPSPLV